MSSTQVKPEVNESSETAPSYSAEVQALLDDKTIVSDRTVLRLIVAVDNITVKEASKWGELIVYCKTNRLAVEVDKESSKELRDEAKHGRQIILKTLLEAGKTEKSAQSIRSFILKMAKEENSEALAKMQAGTMTVREARVYGRTPQANPNKSNEAKYTEALNSAARHAVGALGIGLDQFLRDAETSFAEYAAKWAESKKS
jgi:hypothetical protein